MKSIIPTVVAALVLFLPTSHAELIMRFVVLKMPAKEAPAVRTELASNGSKPEAMDAVLKIPGVSELAGFKETDPWRRDVGFLSRETGNIMLDGQMRKALGVQLVLADADEGIGLAEDLATDIVLPTSATGYREFENTGNCMISRIGKWQERACWGDGTATLILWQYASAEGESDAGRLLTDGVKDALWVEMQWFKVTLSDLEMITRSKPETRGNALQWLSTQAKLWKDCGFRARPDDKISWHDSRGKLLMEEGRVVTKKEMFSLTAEVSETDGKYQLAWEAKARTPELEDVPTHSKSGTITPGIWEFVVIEGLTDANLVACRLSKDRR
ncbi:MAG: hypothetical protein ABIS50_09490 [Luteolibacter sp.]|uniref:hypothetical protein n=1 Tax=Luteolibacter sp. TaxID=1962973 RepID=UPI0032658090